MSAIAEIAVAVATSLAGPCFERIVVPFLGFLCSCFLLEDNIREMRATRSTVNTNRERQLMSGWLSRAEKVEGEFEDLRKSRCSFLPISSQYSNIFKRHGLSRDAASLTNNMRSYRESISASGAGDDIERSSSSGGERATPKTTQVGDREIREGSESRSNLERTAPKTMQVVPKEIAEGSRSNSVRVPPETTEVVVEAIGEGSGSNSVRDIPETKLVVVEEIRETALLVVEEIGEGSESNMARATPETMQGAVVQETGGGSGSNLARSEPETMQVVIQDTREGSRSISVQVEPETRQEVVQETGEGSGSKSAQAEPDTVQMIIQDTMEESASNSVRDASESRQEVVQETGEGSESIWRFVGLLKKLFLGSSQGDSGAQTSEFNRSQGDSGSQTYEFNRTKRPPSYPIFYTDKDGQTYFSLQKDPNRPNNRTTTTTQPCIPPRSFAHSSINDRSYGHEPFPGRTHHPYMCMPNHDHCMNRNDHCMGPMGRF